MERVDVSSQTGSAREESQYLTFTLGAEEYGTDILKVQEIKGYVPITPIPGTPPFVKGVMNLRGAIIPVIDLRMKLDMAETAHNQFTVIIVVRITDRAVGLIVDSVSDVLNLSREAIQATPELGAQVDVRFVSGLAKAGEKLVILLDIERVLGAAEVVSLAAAG
jgi:purine-binding chemotaxis protein CheW